MSLISVSHLTFYYEGSFDNVFEDVSFQIDTNWKLGFVARNGRGKTTFLQLLMGKYEYRGSISATEKFDYFPFEVGDPAQITMEMIDHIFPDCEFWKICRELTLLQVDAEVLQRPFETLSSGEQTKIMLAALFSMEHRFLLIDEPTNHLDAPAREMVREYLKGKKGFILVSHDRDFLDQCVDHVLVVNKTGIEVFQGNFSTWWENKQRRDAFERAENERLQKEIGRLQEAARQSRRWADDVESMKIGKRAGNYEWNKDSRAYIGEKSRRMQMRRKNLQRRQERSIEEKSLLLHDIESAEELKLYPERHYKEVLVKAERLQIFYDAKALPPVDLTIRNGDRIALAGGNGCGKSSVIRAILQARMQEQEDGSTFGCQGKLELAGGLVISYVPQDTGGLWGTLQEYVRENNLDLTVFLTLLRKLDFSREQLEKRIEEYSGGQKKKVLLAGSLCRRAHLYIWDEPLNFVDVFSRMQIEELILKFRPTMLFVEHDKTFVEKIATGVVRVGA